MTNPRSKVKNATNNRDTIGEIVPQLLYLAQDEYFHCLLHCM